MMNFWAKPESRSVLLCHDSSIELEICGDDELQKIRTSIANISHKHMLRIRNKVSAMFIENELEIE